MCASDRNQSVHGGIHWSNGCAARLCIFSSSFTYKLHKAWRRDRSGPSAGRSSWEKGAPWWKLPLACAFPGQARGANQPPEMGKVCRGRLGTSSTGSAFPGDGDGRRTEVQPGWEGSSHRPLLFRHEFLSWHGCPQALYICLIPISLLSFKSTSLSGVITGQFSPHAKFRYCIYYLYVDLGDIVSQFPAR